MGKYLDFENEKYEKGYKSFQLTRESAKANIGKTICYVDYVEPYRGTYFVRYGVIHSVYRSRIYFDEHMSNSVDIRDVKECGIKIEDEK